ncbi:MAG TPA: hypothetical protein VJZ27_15985 [Aggregatilineales bacterium]|nr:hypothetical protein [Aggregatilineales bacterium]
MTTAVSYGLDSLGLTIQQQPNVILKFYDFGIVLAKRQADGKLTEYPVDPAHIASILAEQREEEHFSTGLLHPNTIFIAEKGIQYLVVEWREPQKTGIYLDGVNDPIVVPLPGLLLFRRTQDGKQPDYRLYAAKKRPEKLDAKLYAAPLPNVQGYGSICWGSVQRPVASKNTSLKADWDFLLGSGFGNHAVREKSKTHPKDIREKYYDMVKRHTRRYPLGDLVKAGETLEDVIDRMIK